MNYDWNKSWYDGGMPNTRQSLLQKHPTTILLGLLLAAAALVLWSVL